VNKRVIAIAVAAAVVLTGVWYVVLFSPQSHSLHKANTQTASAKAQQVSLRAQIATLQQEQTQLPAAQAKLTTLQLDLPATAALDKLVDQINADAATTGVDWQNISPAKPATYAPGYTPGGVAGFPSGMQPYTVNLAVKGSYQQVTKFITGLYGISRLFDVDSVNLSGVGATATAITGQVVGQVFFVPPAGGTTTAVTVAP
jgi:Tfp pilus assembly protein PilO